MQEAAERSLQAAVAAAAQATKAEQDKKEAEAAGEDAPRATFMPSLADAQGARQVSPEYAHVSMCVCVCVCVCVYAQSSGSAGCPARLQEQGCLTNGTAVTQAMH